MLKDTLTRFDERFSEVCYMDEENGFEVYADDDIKIFIAEEIKLALEEITLKEKEFTYEEENEKEIFQAYEILGEAFIEGRNSCIKEIEELKNNYLKLN